MKMSGCDGGGKIESLLWEFSDYTKKWVFSVIIIHSWTIIYGSHKWLR